MSARWLAVGLVAVLAVGCRRERAASRLDTLPVLTWAPSPATDAGPVQAPPAAPPVTAAPAPPGVQQAAPADTSPQPTEDEEEESEELAAVEEEQPVETEAAALEEQPAADGMSEQEAARIEQLEQENQVLREELSILQETQQVLAAEIGQLHVELTRLTQLSAIADAYGVEAAELGMLLGTEPSPQPLQFEPTEPTVPPGAEVPSTAMFGAPPMTPATPTVTAPSAPRISGPSTPTVRPPAFQFGAPPAPAAQPLTAVPPTNFGATPVPPTTTP